MSRRQRWCVHKLNFSSVRFQLEGTGVEVIDLMPPTVKTDMTIVLSEGAISLMTTGELVKQSFASLKAAPLRSVRAVQDTCWAWPRARSEQSARTAHSTSALATRIITGNSWVDLRIRSKI